MCLTTRLLVSRPLVSALASAFLRRSRRNLADLTGQRALETPNCLPVESHVSANATRLCLPRIADPPIHVHLKMTTIQASVSPKATRQLTLRAAAGGTGVPPHGNGLGLLLDVLEVLEGALKLPAVDGLGGLPGVLEGDAEVGAASASALSGLNVGGSVADLDAAGVRQPAVPSKFWQHRGCAATRSSAGGQRLQWQRIGGRRRARTIVREIDGGSWCVVGVVVSSRWAEEE